MVRALVLIGSSAALGLWLAVMLLRDRLSPTQARDLRRLAHVCLVAAALLQLLQLQWHGMALFDAATGADRWQALLASSKTHVGMLLWGQWALLLVAIGMAWFGAAWATVVAVLASLVCAGLTGHVAAGGDSAWLGAVAVLHVVLAGLWLGGLPALWTLWARRSTTGVGDAAETLDRAALRGFSRFALPAMLLILASGGLLATRTVNRWAALVATPYGWTLLAKLGLVALALGCAWVLRRSLICDSAGKGRVRTGPWLARESALACGVVAAASTMAGLIPAAHQSFDWPFGFRIAPQAAWLQRQEQVRWPLSAAAAMVVAGLGVAAAAWRRHRRLAVLTAGGCMVAGLALAVPSLSVQAYPSSYHASAAPYDATSIAAGAKLYGSLCAGCHGKGGQGDGPLARGLNPAPADLTAAHLGWHLHGDMYWWITRGFAGSAMPGFEHGTSKLERWQIVNHLMALSLGHQARTLGERPVPNAPWLAAIDFRYPRDDGQFVQLSEWQGAPVLLALIADAVELPRLEGLARQARELSDTGLRAVVVLGPRLQGARPSTLGVDLVYDETGEILAAWSHYRRTLAQPDFRDQRPEPSRMELLVDRHGYVRARWRADEGGGQPATAALRQALAGLAREPEFPPADVHAH
jgi:putative copper resistance protein D